MIIRKKVIVSFIVLMFFIVTISLLSLFITHQIKDDLSFSKQVLKLINIQENMNEVIILTINEKSLINLKDKKSAFVKYEEHFELLEKTFKQNDKKEFTDYIFDDVHLDSKVKQSLFNLFDNEHSIELVFDNIYDIQTNILLNHALFKKLYPQEKKKRNQLQELVFNLNNVKHMQEFGNLKYFSKETLYQYRTKDAMLEWTTSINTIQDDLKNNNHDSLLVLFDEYLEVVNKISKVVISIREDEEKEMVHVSLIQKILKSNQQETVKIEKRIMFITDNFLNNGTIILGSSVIVMLLITLMLVLSIPSKLVSIIQKLTLGVESIENGNYDVKIQIKEDKEFDQIAKTFNHMSQNIKNNQETLEEKIKLRTKELEFALVQVESKKDVLENLSNKLSKYLSPQIYESIFTGKQDVLLESKRAYLTVFFSDIKGFTSLTDSVETEVLTQLLNEYLDLMSQIVLKYGGTIDKYIGDCIMVFFGDPSSKGKIVDAQNCIKMAIEMKELMSSLRVKWKNDGISEAFHIRMGINSGYCTVGNFGSKQRLDYTILGGNVNLASRLESNANPDEILISSETYLLIKNEIQCVKKEKLKVKGITNLVQTYEVVSSKGSSIMIEEQNGFNLSIDLNEIQKENVIEILEKKLKLIKNL
ncbi:MAG: HAMP domain-containing protein [Campylobacteraceae bacterium]|nr:HAMP domain-containing protein [Campylobacteraceae bacterium]